ncbi:ABC transporter substrate-binding protein [Sandaracinobacter neustonicus]|nr:ABC transporter substrate-binding protein [Sandaracinobacter neustonicus]
MVLARQMLLPALLSLALLPACRGPDAADVPLAVDAVGDRAARAIVADAVNAGLTSRDSAGLVIPGLAQSWRVSDDGLSIVFRLRDAQFVGGAKVSAADVVDSLQRARRGNAGALTRDLLAGVTDVNAPLDNVIELRLSTPQPELLELLATPPLAIRARRSRETAGAFLAGAPATGTEKGAVALRANPRYFAADRVALESASVHSTEAEAAIQRFNRGETDLVLGGGLDGFGAARATAPRGTLQLEQPRAALLLLLNQRQEPLSDPRVRRALALAIDRNALGEAFFGSRSATGVPALSPSNIAGYAPPEPGWTAQPFVGRQEEARKLLTEAGFDPVTNRLKLAVSIRQSPGETRLMELVAADLAQVGVDLTLERRDADSQRRAIATGSFQLALTRRDTPVDSPLPFLWPNLCRRNNQGVCLPEADKLYAESWKAPTRGERLTALREAERLWAENGAAIGLVQPMGWSLVSPRLTGFTANPGGSHSLRHLSIDPTRRFLK